MEMIGSHSNNVKFLLVILLVLAPSISHADVLFSEVKTPTGKLSTLQEYRLKELDKYGFRTEVYKGE